MYPLTFLAQLWMLGKYERNRPQEVIKFVCCLLIAAPLDIPGDRIQRQTDNGSEPTGILFMFSCLESKVLYLKEKKKKGNKRKKEKEAFMAQYLP